jgi:hypothetical protein
VFCRIPREAVDAALDYTPGIPFTPDYEKKLHDHFGRTSWVSVTGRDEPGL